MKNTNTLMEREEDLAEILGFKPLASIRQLDFVQRGLEEAEKAYEEDEDTAYAVLSETARKIQIHIYENSSLYMAPEQDFTDEETDSPPQQSSSSQMTGFVQSEQARPTKIAEAYSRFLERKLNQEYDVREFRRRVFGGVGGIDLERGIRFLTSPLAKVLPVEAFAALNLVPLDTGGELLAFTSAGWVKLPETVPLLFRGERSRQFVDRADLPERMQFQAVINLPSFPHSPALRSLWLRTAEYVGVHWPLSQNYGGSVNSDAIFHLTPDLLPMPAYVPFMDERCYLEGIGGSVAVEALRVCERLTASNPVDVWKALKFLVTGEFGVPTMSGRLFDFDFPPKGTPNHLNYPPRALGPVRLEFPPWLTPKEVSDYWKTIRGRMSGIKRQLPTEDDLDLFLLALAETPPDKPFRWKEIWEAWKKKQTAAGVIVESKNPSSSARRAFLTVRDALLPMHNFRS